MNTPIGTSIPIIMAKRPTAIRTNMFTAMDTAMNTVIPTAMPEMRIPTATITAASTGSMTMIIPGMRKRPMIIRMVNR